MELERTGGGAMAAEKLTGRELDAQLERRLWGREVYWDEAMTERDPATGKDVALLKYVNGDSTVPRYSDPRHGWQYIPSVVERLREVGVFPDFRHILWEILDSVRVEDLTTGQVRTERSSDPELSLGVLLTHDGPSLICRAALEATTERNAPTPPIQQGGQA